MNLTSYFEKARRFILRELWGGDLANLPRLRKLAFHWMRTLSLAVHGFVVDKCPLRAAALTLVFVFSLAPALAVGFSVAKGFGAQEKVKAVLYERLQLEAGATESGESTSAVSIRDVMERIFEYVEKTRIEALGLIGLGIMLYAAYKVLSSIEKTMNVIWGIRRRRRLLRRLVDYIAVLVVFPIMLMITALITASLRSETVLSIVDLEKYAFLAQSAGALLGFSFAAAGFWFLYFFFPNRRVPPLSAAAGAIVAAILWQVLQSLHIGLQVGVQKYSAIYVTFAAFPIFVLWLYMSWQVTLFGAELSYAHANQRDMEYGGLTFNPSPAYREQLAVGAMTIAARAFLQEKPLPTVEAMARQLAAPGRVMRDVVEQLARSKLLVELQEDQSRYQPGVPLEHITLGRLVDSVHQDGDESPRTAKALERLGVAKLLGERAQATEQLRRLTLLDVARAEEQARA